MCSRRAIVKFLYTRGLLVLGLIACIVMLMQMSSFHPEPEPHAQPAWQGVCDLSTITNPTNLTTLVIMAYLNHDALMMVLSKYNDCRHFGGILHEIVIVWNNPKLEFDWNHQHLSIDETEHIIPIKVHQMELNSLANRWFISRSHDFKTSSAIFIDDDMFINEYSIQCMLSTFLLNPSKIIAPSHTHLRTTRQFHKADGGQDLLNGHSSWEYQNTYDTTFNMLLPGMSIFNTKYLSPLATVLEEYELLPIINDQAGHCDDISMMLAMSMLHDGRKYLLGIDYILITDYSEFRKQAALTDSDQIVRRYEDRSECLTMIMEKYESTNTAKGKRPINPVVLHDRKVDTFSCHECNHCDLRGCWFSEDADPITKKKVNYWQKKKGIPTKHANCGVPVP